MILRYVVPMAAAALMTAMIFASLKRETCFFVGPTASGIEIQERAR